jgi:hypothetical protein
MILNVASARQLNDAGWSSPVARRAHNPKAAGSNPAPATNRSTLDEARFYHMELWCSGLTCLPVTQETAGSNPVSSATLTFPGTGKQFGSIAQLVEQRTENPRVGGSIPSRATIYNYINLHADLAQLVEQLTCNQ